ncbi:MAG: hypothetical protein P8Z81_09565 [Deinococcales bacterium]|jgi:hypothetical protein
MVAGEIRALLEEAGPGVELESPFLIAPVAGYTPVMGHLVSTLTYARVTTLRAVAGLSVAQLGLRANAHFRWFHVLEDELNPRAQIRVLRKRLPAGAT